MCKPERMLRTFYISFLFLKLTDTYLNNECSKSNGTCFLGSNYSTNAVNSPNNIEINRLRPKELAQNKNAWDQLMTLIHESNKNDAQRNFQKVARRHKREFFKPMTDAMNNGMNLYDGNQANDGGPFLQSSPLKNIIIFKEMCASSHGLLPPCRYLSQIMEMCNEVLNGGTTVRPKISNLCEYILTVAPTPQVHEDDKSQSATDNMLGSTVKQGSKNAESTLLKMLITGLLRMVSANTNPGKTAMEIGDGIEMITADNKQKAGTTDNNIQRAPISNDIEQKAPTPEQTSLVISGDEQKVSTTDEKKQKATTTDSNKQEVLITDNNKQKASITYDNKQKTPTTNDKRQQAPTSDENTQKVRATDDSKQKAAANDNNKKKVPVTDNSKQEVPANDNNKQEVPGTDNSKQEVSATDNSKQEVSETDNSKREVPATDDNKQEVSATDNSKQEVSETDNSKREVPATDDNKQEVPATDNSKQEVPISGDQKQKAPVTDDNKQELPATDDNKQELPATDDNKQEMPATDNSKQEVPATDDNKQEVTATDNSKQEVPTTDDNKQEVPVTDNSKQEVPANDNSKQEVPISGDQKQKAPVTDDNKQELPATDDNKQELPATDDNKQEVPATDNSKQEVPTTDDNKQEVPVTDNSKQEVPANDNSKQEVPISDDQKQKAPVTDDSEQKASTNNDKKQEGPSINDKKQKTSTADGNKHRSHTSDDNKQKTLTATITVTKSEVGSKIDSLGGTEEDTIHRAVSSGITIEKPGNDSNRPMNVQRNMLPDEDDSGRKIPGSTMYHSSGNDKISNGIQRTKAAGSLNNYGKKDESGKISADRSMTDDNISRMFNSENLISVTNKDDGIALSSSEMKTKTGDVTNSGNNKKEESKTRSDDSSNAPEIRKTDGSATNSTTASEKNTIPEHSDKSNSAGGNSAAPENDKGDATSSDSRDSRKPKKQVSSSGASSNGEGYTSDSVGSTSDASRKNELFSGSESNNGNQNPEENRNSGIATNGNITPEMRKNRRLGSLINRYTKSDYLGEASDGFHTAGVGGSQKNADSTVSDTAKSRRPRNLSEWHGDEKGILPDGTVLGSKAAVDEYIGDQKTVLYSSSNLFGFQYDATLIKSSNPTTGSTEHATGSPGSGFETYYYSAGGQMSAMWNRVNVSNEEPRDVSLNNANGTESVKNSTMSDFSDDTDRSSEFDQQDSGLSQHHTDSTQHDSSNRNLNSEKSVTLSQNIEYLHFIRSSESEKREEGNFTSSGETYVPTNGDKDGGSGGSHFSDGNYSEGITKFSAIDRQGTTVSADVAGITAVFSSENLADAANDNTTEQSSHIVKQWMIVETGSADSTAGTKIFGRGTVRSSEQNDNQASIFYRSAGRINLYNSITNPGESDSAENGVKGRIEGTGSLKINGSTVVSQTYRADSTMNDFIDLGTKKFEEKNSINFLFNNTIFPVESRTTYNGKEVKNSSMRAAEASSKTVEFFSNHTLAEEIVYITGQVQRSTAPSRSDKTGQVSSNTGQFAIPSDTEGQGKFNTTQYSKNSNSSESETQNLKYSSSLGTAFGISERSSNDTSTGLSSAENYHASVSLSNRREEVTYINGTIPMNNNILILNSSIFETGSETPGPSSVSDSNSSTETPYGNNRSSDSRQTEESGQGTDEKVIYIYEAGNTGVSSISQGTDNSVNGIINSDELSLDTSNYASYDNVNTTSASSTGTEAEKVIIFDQPNPSGNSAQLPTGNGTGPGLTSESTIGESRILTSEYPQTLLSSESHNNASGIFHTNTNRSKNEDMEYTVISILRTENGTDSETNGKVYRTKDTTTRMANSTSLNGTGITRNTGTIGYNLENLYYTAKQFLSSVTKQLIATDNIGSSTQKPNNTVNFNNSSASKIFETPTVKTSKSKAETKTVMPAADGSSLSLEMISPKTSASEARLPQNTSMPASKEPSSPAATLTQTQSSISSLSPPATASKTETVMCPEPSVNLTAASMPQANDPNLIGTQSVGTRIVHACNNKYIFPYSGQPINIYVCQANGQWTSNIQRHEVCEYYKSV